MGMAVIAEETINPRVWDLFRRFQNPVEAIMVIESMIQWVASSLDLSL